MTTAAFIGAAAKSHKLWGGRFAEPVPRRSSTHSTTRSASTSVSGRSTSNCRRRGRWRSTAPAFSRSTSATTIERGLDAVAARLEAGEQPIASDEDVHTFIDRLLHDEIGDVASKLHTGRSRNDQVATATRLWAMDAVGQLDVAVRQLQQVMIDQAHGLETSLMPSYTHLQRAIPVSAAHWLLSHFWPLERDRARLRAAAKGCRRAAARLGRRRRLRVSDLAGLAARALWASTPSRPTRSTR